MPSDFPNSRIWESSRHIGHWQSLFRCLIRQWGYLKAKGLILISYCLRLWLNLCFPTKTKTSWLSTFLQENLLSWGSSSLYVKSRVSRRVQGRQWARTAPVHGGPGQITAFPTFRAFFLRVKGHPSQMSPADTLLSKGCIMQFMQLLLTMHCSYPDT